MLLYDKVFPIEGQTNGLHISMQSVCFYPTVSLNGKTRTPSDHFFLIVIFFPAVFIVVLNFFKL
ncbi:hypothetical protein AALA98_02345, partial [Lachnospiraceae bacterium 45-W7]